MLYQIADLTLEMPEYGRMPGYMKDYAIAEGTPQVILKDEDFRFDRWKTDDRELQYYMETGRVFYNRLLRHDGMMLHASAVTVDGYAYLFSGPCGMGKSTHTGLYRKVLGDRAEIINDDKPALRRLNGVWYAYGTPWAGKNHTNRNVKVPLAGICFLHRGDTEIHRVTPQDAIRLILGQTQRKQEAESMRLLLQVVDKLVREVPVFELHSHAAPEDARLTYTEMTKAIKETQA